MSFARPQAKTSGLADEVNRLKADVGQFASSDATDPQVQRNASRTVNELRRRISNIEARLPSDPNGSQLQPQLSQVKSQLEQAAGDIQTKIEEVQKPKSAAAGLPPDATQEQLQLAQDQASHLEFLQNQTQSIVEDSKVLNQLTHEVADVIQDSHEKIVKIDQTVAEAKEEMVEGNAELVEAEDHQKKTCNVF
jgi:methyl-accepting chemotaxis protein